MNALKSKIYMMFDNFKMNKFEGVGIIKIKGVSIICMDQIEVLTFQGMYKSQNLPNFFPMFYRVA